MHDAITFDDRRDADAKRLDEAIIALIDGARADEDRFERLALEVFAYQYERNEPYRNYCDRIGATPDEVESWREVPAVPASAFAAARLACFPPASTVVTFVSSGTTSVGAHPSKHELDSTALYLTSLLTHYRDRVLVERTDRRFIAIAPSFGEAPASSLSFMLSAIAEHWRWEDEAFFIRQGEIEFDRLCGALALPEPAVVFGTALAFIRFFDACRAAGRSFSLPAGSRVIETGGFKGATRVVTRDELYAAFTDVLGVPREACTSEYGMCELGSQWYGDGVKVGPHWARATIVDPVGGLAVNDGETGLIQLFDLSNRCSVAAVLTGDLGRRRDGGFELLGRHSGAPPKGCSIAIDALLEAGRA